MNPFFQNIIIKTVILRFIKKNKQIDDRKLLNEVEVSKVNITHFVRDSVFVLIGIVFAGFGLKGFLLPNSFIDGGAMGIALLISEISEWSLAILVVAINLPFLILGFSQVGRSFGVKSIIAIIALALVIYLVQ